MSIQGVNIPNLVRNSATNFVASGSTEIGTSGTSVVVGARPTLYSGSTVIRNSIIWMDRQFTNSSGQAIFYPTDNGAVNGTALFSNVYSITATPFSGTNTISNVPFCSVKEINFGNKEVIINTLHGATVSLLGDLGVAAVGGGVPVYCEIKGN